MAINYLANLKLNGAELQSAAIENRTSAPSSPSTGQIYYNTSDDFIYIYNGSNWDKVGVLYDLSIPTGTTSVRLTGSDSSTDDIAFQGTANEVDISRINDSTLRIGLPNDVTISNDLTVNGDLTVGGTFTTINSTTVSVKDPIIILGGGDDGVALGTDDNLDKGIQFHWHNGTSAKLGFIGYDDSEGRFFVSADVSNTDEVITPNSYGELHVGSLTSTVGANELSIATGSWDDSGTTRYYTEILNTFQDNGIRINTGSQHPDADGGGVELLYNGQVKAYVDSTGLHAVGGFALDNANLNVFNADLQIYSADATGNGRGISFYDKSDGSPERVARFFTAGDQNGKMNFNLNINGSITGGATIWEIREGSAATTLLTVSNTGNFNFQSGDITTTGQVSAGSYSGLPVASVSQQGIVELAIGAEVAAGTDATKAVTPDSLADLKVYATIDVSNSTFTAQSAPYKATIAHNLGTEDQVVELFDSVTKQTIFAEVQRKDFAGTNSVNKTTILFDVFPPNDVEVVIYGGAAGKGGVVSYS